MERKKLDEEKHLLSSTMEEPNKPLSVFIKMEDMPKTKDEFRQEGYTLDREKMGICHIINNVDREQPATRRDVRKAEETWTNLGFDVKLYLNQTKEEMKALRTNEILNDENYKDYNCLVILIIAHGTSKRNVFDVCGKVTWNLDVLEEQVARIKPLEGRPKLLFVEACRGQQTHNVANPSNMKHEGEDMQVSKKEIEEDIDEDYVKLKQSGWVAPSEISTKNPEIDNGALEIDEKTKKRGAAPSMNTQVSTMINKDEQTMPSKRDQFIGLSTVENYVAFTVNTSGSPYLQHLMRQLNEGAFLHSLQTIHQTTRQAVGKSPIHEHRYMVPDEHNRLHADLCFKNHLICHKDKSQPLIKGSISHESPVMLIGVTYNIFQHCPDAHQVFNSGYKIPAIVNTKSHLEFPGGMFENAEWPNCLFDLPKGSVVQCSEEPPRTFMEIFQTPLDYFSEANKHLLNTENKFDLDLSKISERLMFTKPCPGFNIVEHTNIDNDKSKHIVTFHKEYPMVKISLGPENQRMLSDQSIDKNISAIEFDCPKVLKAWIEKCPIHITIEEIHRDISPELVDWTKLKITNFNSHWEHYFGKFGNVQKLKEIVDGFPALKENFSGGNLRQITKVPPTKYIIDCGDYFVNFECPKEIQNGDLPNYKAVKLEELSRDETEEKKETYNDFLNYWGHHFVSEFYVGGSITLELLLTNEDLKNAAQIKKYLDQYCSDEDVTLIKPKFKVIDIKFKGGDIQYHKKSFNEVNKEHMIEWKKSLPSRPMPLMSKVTILPVHLAVACLDPERGEIVRQISEEVQQQGKNWMDKESWNDTEYTGESEDGKPHGQGTSKGSHGTYTGGFKNGDRCGHGKCHFIQHTSEFTENLSYFNGEWMDGKPQGRGDGHFRKGDIYIGQWKNGKPEGLGTVYYEDGSEATVLCRDGRVEDVINGVVKDIQIGTKFQPKKSKVIEVRDIFLDWYNTKKSFEKWLIKAGFLLFILVVTICSGIAIAESLREVTCTETMLAKWDTVSKYNYSNTGFLDVNMFRLDKSSLKICQRSNMVMDLFPVSSKTTTELSNLCKSHAIPESSYSFDNTSNFKVIQRLNGDYVVRFRTCDPKHCKSNNIGCTPVQRYKSLTCLQALANQWDEIAQHNSTDNTLTVDMNMLTINKDLCHMDLDPVNLEMFAVSPNALESETEYFSCKSYGSNSPTVLPFGPKMILNETSLETVRYVSGNFTFRFSRNGNQACTYPKKVYASQNDDNIINIWKNETCKVKPNIIAGTEAKIEDDACIFSVSLYPFFDCYLMDKTLTGTMNLTLLNETQINCEDSETFIEEEAKIIRKSANDTTPILGNVSFTLPMNATFCLEAFVNYPLCPSRNKDDENKCSRPVGRPLTIKNCEKTWGK